MNLVTKVSENGISQYCRICGAASTDELFEQIKKIGV